jgi:TetR/AcrR family transcriptional regulator, transcriptional repressor for nem operon
MPREREFDEEIVVAKAAELFALHGYAATSLAMLLDATGLAKQSLYNAFGDKRGLYLRAVDASVNEFGSAAGSLDELPTGHAAVRHVAMVVVHRCCSDSLAERCCIVTAGLLEGVDDALACARLKEKFQLTHDLVRVQIERGQRDGSIHSAAPSAELADSIMGLFSGLRVAAKAEVGRARLMALAHRGLETLDR